MTAVGWHAGVEKYIRLPPILSCHSSSWMQRSYFCRIWWRKEFSASQSSGYVKASQPQSKCKNKIKHISNEKWKYNISISWTIYIGCI